MSALVVLKELESWTQAEIGAKARLLGLVEAQMAAVRARSPRDLEGATHAVSQALSAHAGSDAARERLFGALAKAYGLPREGLTLGEIARRAGSDGEVLVALRDELRRATSDLLRAVRRMSALSRMHRDLVRDAIAAVAGSSALSRGGVLVDAEA